MLTTLYQNRASIPYSTDDTERPSQKLHSVGTSFVRIVVMKRTTQGTLRGQNAEFFNHLTPNDHFNGRTAPLTYRSCILLFIQQIYVLNILNMLHTLFFFLFKMPFIS